MNFFGFDVTVIAFVLLAGLGVGGVLYAFMFGSIENEQKRNKRLAQVKVATTDSAARRKAIDKNTEGAKRRKQVSDSLDNLDAKNKARAKNVKNPPMKVMLAQAGLNIDMKTFYIASAVTGLVMGAVSIVFGLSPLYAIGVAFASTFGLPRWVVGFLRKRRVKQFLEEFPNSIDVIVRAIKSGLPLNDGLRLISTEAREPVKTEFQRIVEAQQLGMSTPEACARMYESMPTSEANFFAVVIQIQSSAGGNLAEALANLSGVLRARKTMKAKIAAMSMEAKASAAIIGALPIIVAVMVYLTSPDYIIPLFTTDTGFMILAISAVWMAIGIFVMRQMINFEV